jgi:glycosyltransferase involved in cell wall biosynthesis
MRILEVNHGYPPRYNAGSELYTQTTAIGLASRGHTVAVFTREEDPYSPDFTVIKEPDELDESIVVYLANHARSRDRYQHRGMDEAFRRVLQKFKPDIVHVNHLNHLSVGILQVTSDENIPLVFTLHDYWLACPRGQFLQMALGEPCVYPECPGQDDERCSNHCMSRIWGGVDPEADHIYWTKWVHTRMNEVKRLSKLVDLFISPSHYLRKRIINELNLQPEKVVYEPYGFDATRLADRVRGKETGYTFGYIGRIVSAKGIDLLIKAFGKTTGDARLRIWGRPNRQDTPALKRLSDSIPQDRANKIEWLPEYRNEDIVPKVFNHVDSIIVPSIWDENSPLVIQEALQANVPVITSDKGGMGELIKHGLNGWNFSHRSEESLAKVMQNAIDNPQNLVADSKRGYLGSETGEIHRIDKHVTNLEKLFNAIGGMK